LTASISFALHDMPLDIRKKVLEETERITTHGGVIIIVDYALPKTKIAKCLCYLIRFYESKYYLDFLKSDLECLIKKHPLELKERVPVMIGCGRILKYKRK